MRRKIGACILLFCFVMMMSVCAYAAKKSDFSGDVTFVKQEKDRYIFQVTAGNQGKDFTGYVRIFFDTGSQQVCAYDTKIVLPSQGQKQFTLTVLEGNADSRRGKCYMEFVSEKGEVLEQITIANAFGNSIKGIPVGVLSDEFDSLTYLDAGGANVYVFEESLPLSLVPCDGATLVEQLDVISYLVIDAYDTSSLDQDTILAVEKWVNNGGCLILGTGARAEDVFSGFDSLFLGATVSNISEKGEENFATQKLKMDAGYYYYYKDSGIDMANMQMAEFLIGASANYYGESADFPGFCTSVQNGSITLVSHALSDPEMINASWECVSRIYEESYYHSSGVKNGVTDANHWSYQGRRTFGAIDGENVSMDFGILKILIILYVVLAGPILYLILRKCKKNEWYWISAPVLGLFFIVLIFVFGQGSQVRDAKVYSITTQKLNQDENSSYLMAYRPGVKEWTLALDENVYAGGMVLNEEYYYSSGTADYRYLIRKDEKGNAIGLRPEENFENAYFKTKGTAKREGEIVLNQITFDEYDDVSGTVLNDTDYDFKYLAVMTQNDIYVVADVKAHETVDLLQADKEKRLAYERTGFPYFSELYYDMVDYGYQIYDCYERDAIAALYLGLQEAYADLINTDQNVVLAGLVEDYDKLVVDKCNETSWGCLYNLSDAAVIKSTDEDQVMYEDVLAR